MLSDKALFPSEGKGKDNDDDDFDSLPWFSFSPMPLITESVITLICSLNLLPNSNRLGIEHFVSGISISFKNECYIIMQIQHTKNLYLRRIELGTTLS